MLVRALLCTAAFTLATASFSKVTLSTSSPVAPLCNDGSPYVYYVRPSFGSNKWVLFYQGGGYCFDQASCSDRQHTQGNLMTSKGSKATIDFGEGILSGDSRKNPLFAQGWNSVYLPYCTSDVYSGTAEKSSLPLVFLGSRVPPAVIADLKLNFGLVDSATTTFLVTGSSSGAVGLYGQIDNINSKLLPKSHVLSLVDSGWFQDSEPFVVGDCETAMTCTTAHALQLGHTLWKPLYDSSCAATKQDSDLWKCQMAQYVAEFISTPLFFFEYRFDWAQMRHDGISTDPGRGGATMKAYGEMNAANVTSQFAAVQGGRHSMFAVTCYYHAVLNRVTQWPTIAINGTKLMDALQKYIAGQENQLYVDYAFDTPNYNPTCPFIKETDTQLL